MSTKGLRRLLQEARRAAVDGETLNDAEAEVEAIERAARIIVRRDHNRLLENNDAVAAHVVMTSIAKDAPPK